MNKLTDKLRVVVVVAMMLIVGISANSQSFSVDGISYTITSSTESYEVKVVSQQGGYSGDVVIPESVTYNEIVYSVTSIGTSAFQSCSGLTSVEIPNSVTSIGYSAFSGCSGLTSVYISDLEAYCNIEFRENSSNPVYYAENLYLNGELIKDLVIPEGVEIISDYLFYGLSHIQSVEIPNSVTSIGDRVFYSCSGLTSVEIGNSVTSIGERTFQSCSGLTSVEIGNSVTSIGSAAFSGCTGLTSIEIPNSVTSIGSYAFQSCSGLTSVYISDLEAYCNIEFENESANPVYFAENLYLNGELIEDLVIPEGVEIISDYLFYGLSHIQSVEIPNSVTSIGTSAFYDCDGLTSVEISNSVTSIGSYAFYSCSGLTSVEIPNSVTSIGSNAFESCSGLTSVEIPNSVTSIGDRVFYSCSGLTGILTLPSSLNSIGVTAFGETHYKVCRVLIEEPVLLKSGTFPSNLETLIVPLGTKDAYKSALIWQDIELIVEEGSCEIEVSNPTAGQLMTVIATEARQTPALVTGMKVSGTLNDTDLAAIKSNMTSLLHLDISETDYTALPDKAFKDKMTLLDIKLPKGLKSIGAEAFSGCVALEDTIEVPTTVTSIGNSAFYNCKSLPAITLPIGLLSIGSSTFESCSGLTSIEIPNSVTSIGNNAFYRCTGLTTATLPTTLTSIPSKLFYGCQKLAEFEFPTAITMIGNDAFYGCSSLTTIDLKESTTLASIGSRAFYNCSKIATINFPTSLTSIGASAFANCRSLTEMSVPTMTPPTLVDDSKPFEHVDNLECILSIPKDSMTDYLIAQYWGAFVSIAEKEEINVEVGTEEEIENGGNGHGNNGNGHGYGHDKHGCDIHYHKGGHKGHGPHHMPGMNRVAAEESTYTAEAITYSGSSVFVEGEECVTFVLTPQEGYEIDRVLYDGEDVTNQLVGNTFTTPVAEAGVAKSLQVIVIGGPAFDLGDANGDMSVNVTDVVAITNHILGTTSANFQTDASDVNGDGDINITDVVAVTNIILGVGEVNESPSSTESTTTSELTMTSNGRDENGIQTIDVTLHNDISFTAFQADLRLPEGVELQEVVLSDRASNSHSINHSMQADGSYRLISYSMVNEAYADNQGKLFTLVLKVENSETGILSLENIIFTTPQAIGYNLDDVVMEVAGTTSIGTTPTATRIYSQARSIIIESPTDGIAVISGIDGVARQVKVKAGRNEYAVSEEGMYIVRYGEKAKKVVIK